MKPSLRTLVIALLATVAFAPAQEAPAKKKKMAPLNQVSEPRMGKIYSTKPENKRFTVRLDDNQWVVTPEKTNKVVAFQVAENSKITIDGAEGKVEELQKGMRVTVIPQLMDPGKADKVEATKSAPDEKKAGETEE
jgi:membrane protein implicated in regulation of membrane protease activity